MPVIRRQFTYTQPASGGGGGGPVTALVAWGPDYGGVDGDRNTIGTYTSLTLLGLSHAKSIGVDERLAAVAATYNAQSIALQQATTFGPVYPAQSIGVDERLAAVAATYNAQSIRATTALVSYQFIYAAAGTYSLTAPLTANYRLDAHAGGGSGGGGQATYGGGGGAGGQFARTNALAVTIGATLTIRVAATVAGGAALTGPGVVGNDSWISNTGAAPASTAQGVLAKGGGGGAVGGALSGGTGGTPTTTGNIGDTVRNGANGATGALATGGVGGGGAGTDAAGSGQTGGSQNGGNGGGSGAAGSAAGGGGGGGGTAAAGGGGAIGRCTLTITL